MRQETQTPARAARLLGGLLIGSVAVGLACSGSRFPHPPYVPQATSALVEVPYPPPPGRVEVVPPEPDVASLRRRNDAGEESATGEPVWVDGGWRWSGQRWTWHRGRWVVVPPGVVYAPWTLVRRKDGALFFAPGAWRDAHGGEATEPEALAVASYVVGSDAGALSAPRAVRRASGGSRDGGSLGVELPALLAPEALDAGTTRDEDSGAP